jgi:hypothetical protein
MAKFYSLAVVTGRFLTTEHLQGVTKLRNLEESSDMWFLKPSFRLETGWQKRKCEWL